MRHGEELNSSLIPPCSTKPCPFSRVFRHYRLVPAKFQQKKSHSNVRPTYEADVGHTGVARILDYFSDWQVKPGKTHKTLLDLSRWRV